MITNYIPTQKCLRRQLFRKARCVRAHTSPPSNPVLKFSPGASTVASSVRVSAASTSQPRLWSAIPSFEKTFHRSRTADLKTVRAMHEMAATSWPAKDAFAAVQQHALLMRQSLPRAALCTAHCNVSFVGSANVAPCSDNSDNGGGAWLTCGSLSTQSAFGRQVRTRRPYARWKRARGRARCER